MAERAPPPEDTEYSLQPVPLVARLSLMATILLWASLTLDPSAPYLASWWGSSFPFVVFLVGTIVANLVLSIFSSLSGYIASKEGLTYALATEKVYGSKGAAIPAFWAGIVSVGWLAFSIGVVAEGIQSMLSLPAWLYYLIALLMVLLFMVTAYLGVKHIVKLAMIGVPLLIILIVAGVGLSTSKYGTPQMGSFDASLLPVVFGLVLGTFVNGSIVLSFDYQRFCRRPKDAVLTAFTNFLIFWSFIIILSGIPAAVLGKDLYGTYVQLGLRALAIVTLFILAWTSADNQLYSSSLSWTLGVKTLGSTVDRRKVVFVAAALTVILSWVKLHTFAVSWLSLLTSVSLPAGVVLWTDYFLVSKGRWTERNMVANYQAFLSWFLGSVTIWYLHVHRQFWYGILAGFLVTFIVYYIIGPRRK
ncbi:MAG: hypothetical protein DRN14_02035 [Thermoplasmata archaeon]|nr:MAG: hypothetical protein DRN14_02035 [Thermoplasmata archaeon]HDJ27379.1 hypothetical protein [Aciduliprofundum sp.]